MRNPFKRDAEKGKPFDTPLFDVDKGRERFLERLPGHPISKVEEDILYNAVVIELGIPSKQVEAEANDEGQYGLMLIDEDGFLMNKNGRYLLPAEVRAGNTFVEFIGVDPTGGNAVQMVDKAELERQKDN